MWHILIVAGILVCAVMTIRVKHLLMSAVWLAGTSALVALLIYLLGAPEIAVIELSVGAGLVTVLFVFAINIAGADSRPVTPSIPKPLAWFLVVLVVTLSGWMIFPAFSVAAPAAPIIPFAVQVWNFRAADTLLQIVLIFSGVLGVIGLLTEDSHRDQQESKS
jgi:uncharacterized MnhB-related membrane protein